MACYKRGKVFWYAFTFNGQRIQRSTKVTNRKEAVNIEKAAWVQYARAEVGIEDKPKPERKTIGELLDALEADYKLRGKDTAPNRSTVGGVRRDFGWKMADSLKSEDVDRYIEKRLADGARPATVNRTLETLRRAFHLAKLKPPEIRHLSEKDNVRTGFFSAAEFRAVLSHLPADLKDFVLFGYLAGWRKGSIASLRWTDVDLEAGEINLPGEFVKNGEPLKMAIEGELAELMARRKEAQAVTTPSGAVISALVFHRDGQPVREFRKSWRTATKLAGCPGRLFHDLRRTSARDLIRSGVPESVAMRVTGHKTNSMFRRYDITNADDLRAALRTVEKYRDGQQQKVVSISAQGGG